MGLHIASDENTVIVGVGEIRLAEHPRALVTQALGSCVGVALWDPLARAGAMAHVMLPSSEDTTAGGPMERFADHAVPTMVELLQEAGMPRRRLVAKIAGGAAMFRGDTPIATIGARNIDEVRRQLSALTIPVRAEDVGGSHARTIELRLDTGILLVRSYLHGLSEI